MVNLGLSIHVAADEHALHMMPIGFLRLFGAMPASIPWNAMKADGRNPRKVRINGQVLHGPKWCMELAEPSPE